MAEEVISKDASVQEQKIAIYKDDLKNISGYLNAIKTFVSPFTQTTMSGGVSTGMFYLSRPGKLRWEYDPPVPLLIVAKGSLLAYYDSELDEVSHVGAQDTLAGFLTRKIISFDDPEIEILRFDKDDQYTAVTISQTGKEDEGQLRLMFRNSPIELARMVVLDAVGEETQVDFTSIVNNAPLDNSLFRMPRTKKRGAL